ncbi:Hypothetical protein AKI40_1217 [Enterobacter sp. FY-07]|nr:Hypothetical protein AKI40_1217 [Enterobacter sp. FY-07]
MALSEWYGFIGEDGKIVYIVQGPQPEPGYVQLDLSSDLYHEFYYRMPEFIRWSLPDPEGPESQG